MKINKFNRVLLLFVLVFITTAGTLLAGELMDKVFRNDIEAVKKILADGADINERDENIGGAGKGATPLFIACSYYEEMAKLLISKGADVNIKTYGGDSPLMAACFNSEELVDLLLSKGADINAKNNDGTGVFAHCIMGIMQGKVSTGLAERLLSKGANVDEAPTSGDVAGYTSLMIAANNGQHDLAKFLISKGADVNAKAKDGSTALSLATKENDTAMVKLLKDFGARE